MQSRRADSGFACLPSACLVLSLELVLQLREYEASDRGRAHKGRDAVVSNVIDAHRPGKFLRKREPVRSSEIEDRLGLYRWIRLCARRVGIFFVRLRRQSFRWLDELRNHAFADVFRARLRELPALVESRVRDIARQLGNLVERGSGVVEGDWNLVR